MVTAGSSFAVYPCNPTLAWGGPVGFSFILRWPRWSGLARPTHSSSSTRASGPSMTLSLPFRWTLMTLINLIPCRLWMFLPLFTTMRAASPSPTDTRKSTVGGMRELQRQGCLLHPITTSIWVGSNQKARLRLIIPPVESAASLASRERRLRDSMSGWFAVQNVEEVASPALLLYPNRVRENIRRMIRMAGGPSRLRPHIKTHKLPEIVR